MNVISNAVIQLSISASSYLHPGSSAFQLLLKLDGFGNTVIIFAN